MQALEFLFRFAIVTRVLHGLSFRVGQEGGEAHIDDDGFAGRHMFDDAIGLGAKLDIVAISPAHEPYPLDVFGRNGLYLLFLLTYRAQTRDPTPVHEDA